jgi:hypothetical protein
MHEWTVERIRGRRRSVAMPASFKRICRRCGAIEHRSGNVLGDTWHPLTRHNPNECLHRLEDNHGQ